ncbi:hypothetical protein E5A73_11315 [Sphingomonas gei]|uniref:STAS/SEC14 domain-containing protein n=1 Tax=Sphingomonas gei TaxID=1395960 RepID=A0A4S1XC83_9SPHN|nr:hypothetical protein [Sphingomonas gei]TGX53425.1 hypothetical protein E5A73_11315 [Sphingomonas gei]
MYSIQVDTAHDVVEVTLGGLMPLDEVAAYIADLKHTIATHKLDGNYAMVIDVSACPIQSQDMIKAMGAHMATMPKARSLAIVTGSSLARMQIRRLFTQPYARIVATLDQGRAWVISGTEPTA